MASLTTTGADSVWATVLDIGPTADVYVPTDGDTPRDLVVGDRVGFPRGFFERHERFDDGSFVGWIRDVNIWCVEDPDEVAAPAFNTGVRLGVPIDLVRGDAEEVARVLDEAMEAPG